MDNNEILFTPGKGRKKQRNKENWKSTQQKNNR